MKIVLFVLLLFFAVTLLQGDEKRDPTVGAEGFIVQIILSGTELVGKPIASGDPLIVRAVQVFPHGDSFRYDFQFHGFEPGKYDLAEFLVRKDGTPTGELSDLMVEIRSLLPPGQVEPNPLRQGWLPRLGGYRVVAVLAVVLWVGVLLGMIFLGHKKKLDVVAMEKVVTLADLLRPRLTAAIENRMEPTQYAELERMLFAFWRRKLELESVSAGQALSQIHDDPDSGPLMKQLEQWMHNPTRDQDIDLAKLLEPYQQLPADSAGFEP